LRPFVWIDDERRKIQPEEEIVAKTKTPDFTELLLTRLTFLVTVGAKTFSLPGEIRKKVSSELKHLAGSVKISSKILSLKRVLQESCELLS